MTEQQPEKKEAKLPAADEHYEEPAPMTRKDAFGVVIALIGLVLIGAAGYIWMTPGVSFSALIPSASKVAAEPAVDHQSAPVATVQKLHNGASEDAGVPAEHSDMQPDAENTPGDTMAHAAAAPEQESEMGGDSSLLADPHLHDHDLNCAYCGMFSEKSLSHSVAQWSDGSHTHHDSWGCLFSYGQNAALALEDAVVLKHGSTPEEPVWIAAQQAWFLYDTKKIKGSMPPFVAAFETKAAAQAAKAELGGEVLDFVGLSNKWE